MIGGTPLLIRKGMYSRKEKLEHFNHLAGAKYGAVDLHLLTDERPTHKDLSKFARDPKRYANEILYALLDVCTVDDIQNNRAYYERMMQDADALGAQAVASQSAIENVEQEAKPVDDGSSEALSKGDEVEEPYNDEKENETKDGSSETLSKEEPAEPESTPSDAPPEDAKKK